ncbi:polyphenol oxidase family protein [candidate division WOR-3 bacterium]|nr:polyphenol oxidase family protein [candidate division WOR-3 bacterium]
MKFSVGADQERCVKIYSPTFLKQIHSATIIDLDEDDSRIGDGLLTRDLKKTMGIKVADCLPVYMYNNTAMCIIHCGWRGILGGIARKARRIMRTYRYVLGACIGPECYEVKQDVTGRFTEEYPAAVKEHDGCYFLDLKKAVIQDLGQAALIADLDLCTKCHPEFFFSYRRGDREKRNYAIMSRT